MDNLLTKNGLVFECLLTSEQIQERNLELGKQIQKDFLDKEPVFLMVLKGSLIFFADLIRAVYPLDIVVDTVEISSYANEEISSGVVAFKKEPTFSLKGRDVVIVEDIVDSGRSITFLRDYCLAQEVKTVRIAALLHKVDKVTLPFSIDYVGFVIPDVFVIGYGLDYQQLKRNLPAVYYKK